MVGISKASFQRQTQPQSQHITVSVLQRGSHGHFFEDGWNWLPNPTNTRLNKQRSPRHVCGKTLKPSPLYHLLWSKQDHHHLLNSIIYCREVRSDVKFM